MKRDIPIAVVIAPVLLIVAVVGYFFLVKPKQDEAGRTSNEIAELETQIAVAQAAAQAPATGQDETIRVADVFRVTKAMPDEDDMPGILLELDGVASASGVRFVSISPQAPVVQSTYTALPVNLSFEGNYYDLTDFLFRLRNLVSVRDGKLEADGRLYTLDTLTHAGGAERLPRHRSLSDRHRVRLLDDAGSGGGASGAGVDRHDRDDHHADHPRDRSGHPVETWHPRSRTPKRS